LLFIKIIEHDGFPILLTNAFAPLEINNCEERNLDIEAINT